LTALVWRQADGQLPVETIVDRMREGSSGISEDDVWSALESLSKAHLLVEPIAGPSLAFIQSHRQMMGQGPD
jgi:Fe2+ or Zn2+ uptake regulation protein